MAKDTSILILGLIVAVTPLLGIPGDWKTILFISAGILISSLAFLIKRDREMQENKNRGFQVRHGSDGIVTSEKITLHEGSATEE